MKCSDFSSWVSATYPDGTFNSGDRVEGSVGVYYVITGTTSAQSGLSITSTGQTGCP